MAGLIIRDSSARLATLEKKSRTSIRDNNNGYFRPGFQRTQADIHLTSLT
jgi:hypothetical protein